MTLFFFLQQLSSLWWGIEEAEETIAGLAKLMTVTVTKLQCRPTWWQTPWQNCRVGRLDDSDHDNQSDDDSDGHMRTLHSCVGPLDDNDHDNCHWSHKLCILPRGVHSQITSQWLFSYLMRHSRGKRTLDTAPAMTLANFKSCWVVLGRRFTHITNKVVPFIHITVYDTDGNSAWMQENVLSEQAFQCLCHLKLHDRFHNDTFPLDVDFYLSPFLHIIDTINSSTDIWSMLWFSLSPPPFLDWWLIRVLLKDGCMTVLNLTGFSHLIGGTWSDRNNSSDEFHLGLLMDLSLRVTVFINQTTCISHNNDPRLLQHFTWFICLGGRVEVGSFLLT